jgi:hypothetical protein
MKSLSLKVLGMLVVLAGMAGILPAPAPPVPEINPDSARTAIALLSGAFLILQSRRK